MPGKRGLAPQVLRESWTGSGSGCERQSDESKADEHRFVLYGDE